MLEQSIRYVHCVGNQRILLGASLGVILLGIALTVAYGLQLDRAMQEQFDTRAKLFTQTVADLVAEDDPPSYVQSLTEGLVKDTVIYAQVVRDGEVIAERNGTSVPLTVSPSQSRQSLERGESPADVPYLDVRRALAPPPREIDPTSYVRVGFSLAPHQQKVLRRQAEIAAWALGGVLVCLVGIRGYAAWSRARSGSHGRSPPRDGSNPDPTGPAEATNGAGATPDELRHGPLRLDDRSKAVWVNGTPLDLSPKEFELLQLFMRQPGTILSNEEIIDSIWADDRHAMANDVRKYVYLLRQKIEADPKDPRWIETVRGFGYRLARIDGD